MKTRLSRWFLLMAVAQLASCQTQAPLELQDGAGLTAQPAIVLTSVGPLYSITNALLENTAVEVKNVPERARSMAAQPSWFARQSEPFYDLFNQATAVVSMGNLWQQDALYLTVREQNISVVNIDATLPYSSQLTGVSVINSPSSGEPSAYFWLSPANIIRSAKIVSNDLVRLFPDDAEQIRSNEEQISSELLTAKNQFELVLANTDSYAYLLADEFTYLTNEFGIFVEDYFVKQDINWTEDDLQNLTRVLKENSVPVVIHKWQPSDAIQAAIAAAGSQLVVLDTFETSTVDIHELATANIKQIAAVLPAF